MHYLKWENLKKRLPFMIGHYNIIHVILAFIVAKVEYIIYLKGNELNHLGQFDDARKMYDIAL